jgi:ABC-type Fe3+/spermidine/putrescine transport system ATPase subunit
VDEAPFLRVAGISKTFGRHSALRGVDFAIGNGEFLTLLGPSGCGKTTLLRIIAGLERPDEGRVFLDGEDITDRPPEKRRVNLVFQSYALFPHLSVYENVAYGLRAEGLADREVGRRVEDALAMMRLAAFKDRAVDQLSGGQQQRVALARATAKRPAVLLLDEPLAALDLKLRQEMQDELRLIQHTLGTTFILVTHDQSEALVVSDRVAVMNDGEISQLGTPREVYERPSDRFVADFVGQTNFVPCQTIDVDDDVATVRFSAGETASLLVGDDQLKTGDEAVAILRPEHLAVSAEGEGLRARLEATVFLGPFVRFDVRLASGEAIRIMAPSHEKPVTERDVIVQIRAGTGTVIPATRRPEDDRGDVREGPEG